ncbi:hypothetical protein C7212DRAFT_361529 [Tuber magnatum]|uniref:Uncharacterized protein n=1 Tax=Tuber magnatum TaxID=42249 RepID=A0A317T404_9PEZI|nr:hypothetical protein C7212DRAFT_361529 [Tuber magnatum]
MTPLMSDLLERTTITRTSPDVATQAVLMPLEGQESSFSTRFAYIAFQYTWRDKHFQSSRPPILPLSPWTLRALMRTDFRIGNTGSLKPQRIWEDLMPWYMDHYNGTWKGDVYVPHRVSALFCKPSYWKQEVEIKVSVETGAIADSTAIGEREPFTEFNREILEDAVVTGRLAPENTIWDVLPGMDDFGYFPDEFPDADYQLKQKSSVDCISENSPVNHLNPRSLTSFAMEAEVPQTLPYLLLYPPRFLETYKKPFRLLFALAISEELDLQGTEFMSQHLLEEVLLWGDHRYCLRLIEVIGPQIDKMRESTFAVPGKSVRVLSLSNSKDAMTPVKRIPRIGGATSASRLLFGYLPTLVAVSIEPLWALLGRYACMVTPFEHLNRIGGVSAKSALTISCERTPPHFQLWHAYSLKSTLIGVLSSVILFANLLAIALGSLFEPVKAVKSVNDQYYNVMQPILWPQNISAPSQERLGAPFPELKVHPEPEIFYVLWGNPSGHMHCRNGPLRTGHQGVISRRVKTRGFGANVKCKLLKNEDWDVTLNISSNSYHAEIEDECAGEVALNRAISPSIWGRSAPDSGYEWSPALPSGEFSKTEMVGIKCSQELRTVEAWVDISPKETILSVQPLPNTEQSLPDSFFSALALALAGESETPVQSSLDLSFQWGLANSASKLNRTLGTMSGGELDPSFEPHPLKWVNHLMKLSDPTMNRKETHLPNEAALVKTFEKTITSIFATYLSIRSQQLFLPTSGRPSDLPPTPIPGYTYLTDDRITLSPAMFTITIFIISFFILVKLLVYMIRPGRNLTHLPTTLGATYALVYASNVLDDLAGVTARGYRERLKAFERLEHRYSYGEFVGGDGREHFGVFKEAGATDP